MKVNFRVERSCLGWVERVATTILSLLLFCSRRRPTYNVAKLWLAVINNRFAYCCASGCRYDTSMPTAVSLNAGSLNKRTHTSSVFLAQSKVKGHPHFPACPMCSVYASFEHIRRITGFL